MFSPLYTSSLLVVYTYYSVLRYQIIVFRIYNALGNLYYQSGLEKPAIAAFR